MSDRLQIVTHGDTFHDDEVMACAILFMLHGRNLEICRTRDVDIIRALSQGGAYVLDVGLEYDPMKRKFDHHQPSASHITYSENYENPCSSAGMVWKEYGTQVCDGDAEMADTVYSRLIMEIDLGDNGLPTAGRGREFRVGCLNPSWNQDSNGDEEFKVAVLIALTYLQSTMMRAQSVKEASIIHEETLKNSTGDLLLMKRFYPWKNQLGMGWKHRFNFAVYPKNGDWVVSAIPVNPHDGSYDNKMLLPEEWVENPPQGVKFIHKYRFLMVTESLSKAIFLANQASNMAQSFA